MTETPPETLYCYIHPNRETVLRCNRCNRPICSSCAILTPTGYRCKECVRGQQKIFDTARWWDYPLAVVVAGGMAMLASLIGSRFGFFTIFVAPITGMIIAEAVRAVVSKHRSKPLLWAATAASFLGAILLSLGTLLLIFVQGSLAGLLGLIWPAVFAFLTASTVYYRLAGIRL
ncbi:MAG: hypothetical protein ABFD24_03825 [Anaerolineaceae bacterium]